MKALSNVARLVLVAVACLTFSAQGHAEPLNNPIEEVPFGIEITFEVADGGCTDKNSFHFRLKRGISEEASEEVPVILLVRNTSAMCKGLMQNKKLTWSLDEIKTSIEKNEEVDFDLSKGFRIGNHILPPYSEDELNHTF